MKVRGFLQGTNLQIARRALGQVVVRGIADPSLAASERDQEIARRAAYSVGIRIRSAENVVNFIWSLEAWQFVASLTGHRVS